MTTMECQKHGPVEGAHISINHIACPMCYSEMDGTCFDSTKATWKEFEKLIKDTKLNLPALLDTTKEAFEADMVSWKNSNNVPVDVYRKIYLNSISSEVLIESSKAEL